MAFHSSSFTTEIKNLFSTLSCVLRPTQFTNKNSMSGYFGIGIYYNKSKKNIGTLWRSAHLFEASFIYTILKRYDWQPTDTLKSYRHVPLFHHADLAHFVENLPKDCELIGVELVDASEDIMEFCHPKRAVYLLGAEDSGLLPEILSLCKKVVRLPGKYSMNVSTAGSLIMYDRLLKSKKHDL